MRRDYTIEYEFTSSRADGDNYTRRRSVRASYAREALVIAGIIGFTEFGARFTDNCVDWRIV